MDCSKITTERLIELRDNILKRTAHWKNCTDGSYELALDSGNYYTMIEELESRGVVSEGVG